MMPHNLKGRSLHVFSGTICIVVLLLACAMPRFWINADESKRSGKRVKTVVANGPDLVLSALTALDGNEREVKFSYVITNIGEKPADLSMVSVQSFFSFNTVLEKDDIPAGGTFLGRPPLDVIRPGESRTGTWFASKVKDGEVRESSNNIPYLIVKIDFNERVDEINESNNLAIVGIGNKPEPDKDTR